MLKVYRGTLMFAALFGAFTGLLVGVGVLVVPGIGPIRSAGTLATALLATTIGAVIGAGIAAVIVLAAPTGGGSDSH